MDAANITLEQVKEIVAGLPRDRVNPTSTNGAGHTACVYTGADNTHCIAGEVLVRLGFEVPGFGDRYNWNYSVYPLAKSLGLDKVVCSYLRDLQRLADGMGGNPVPWGDAIDAMEGW